MRIAWLTVLLVADVVQNKRGTLYLSTNTNKKEYICWLLLYNVKYTCSTMATLDLFGSVCPSYDIFWCAFIEYTYTTV